jgi:hypothetical protein
MTYKSNLKDAVVLSFEKSESILLDNLEAMQFSIFFQSKNWKKNPEVDI